MASPYLTNATPGAALPTDALKYLEHDVVVTNPQRRLHGFDRAFGPGTSTVFGNSAYNWVYIFDETHSNPLTQYVGVAFGQIVNGTEFFNAGPVTLPGGDRRGARFAVQRRINSSDWGGIRTPLRLRCVIRSLTRRHRRRPRLGPSRYQFFLLTRCLSPAPRPQAA